MRNETLLIRPTTGIAFSAVAAAGFFCASSPSAGATPIAAHLTGTSAVAEFVARRKDTEFRLQDALAEIKDRGGLTWAQIGTLVGVSRKAVHDWVNGAIARPASEDKVRKIRDRIRAFGAAPRYLIRDHFRAQLDVKPIQESREPAIMVADTEPFAHQLAVGPSAKVKVRRK